MNTQRPHRAREVRAFVGRGHLRCIEDIPAHRTKVVAVDRDIRTELPLGESHTNRSGAYRIECQSGDSSTRSEGQQIWLSRRSIPTDRHSSAG
jgi:hypothetical protein